MENRRKEILKSGGSFPLLSGVAAGRPVSLEELRYFSPVGEEYRLKSASSNSLKTLRPISSSSRADWPLYTRDTAGAGERPSLVKEGSSLRATPFSLNYSMVN